VPVVWPGAPDVEKLRAVNGGVGGGVRSLISPSSASSPSASSPRTSGGVVPVLGIKDGGTELLRLGIRDGLGAVELLLGEGAGEARAGPNEEGSGGEIGSVFDLVRLWDTARTVDETLDVGIIPCSNWFCD
jgi:hypothetical protein